MAATTNLPSPALCAQQLQARSQAGSRSLLPPQVRTAALPRASPPRPKGAKVVLCAVERGPGRALCMGSTDGWSSPQASPSDFVHGFYSSVNGKDLGRLRELLSNDCVLEDLAFSKPLRGRKDVMRYLEKLTGAMGKNLKFVTDGVCEGKQVTAAAIWHLEWNGKRVPFTRGCSFYEFSPDGGELLIRKALVSVESPLKPGELALELLKILTSVFDKFPKLAGKFLERPDAVVQFMMKIYKIFIEPMILPFLFYQAQLWKCVVGTLQSLLSFIFWVLTMFS